LRYNKAVTATTQPAAALLNVEANEPTGGIQHVGGAAQRNVNAPVTAEPVATWQSRTSVSTHGNKQR